MAPRDPHAVQTALGTALFADSVDVCERVRGAVAVLVEWATTARRQGSHRKAVVRSLLSSFVGSMPKTVERDGVDKSFPLQVCMKIYAKCARTC